MALFSAIGDAFVAKILKQISHDYKLDYEEMKSRYCGKSSFEHFEPRTKSVTVDLETEVPKEASPAPKEVPPAPKKAPKAPKAPKIPSAPIVPDDPMESLTASMSSLAVVPASSEVLPLSKMKKRDLELELERRGLCPDGTIPELKDRVKQARLLEKPVKKARKPKDPNAPKKERKAKTPPNSPAPPSSPVKVPTAPVKVVEPEEDEEEEDRSDLADDQEFMDEMDEDGGRMDRLRAILASAGECEEEDYEDE